MADIDEALESVQRAAAWLEDMASSLVEKELPFNSHRAKTMLTAFTGVDEARVRYNRALLEIGILDGK